MAAKMAGLITGLDCYGLKKPVVLTSSTVFGTSRPNPVRRTTAPLQLQEPVAHLRSRKKLQPLIPKHPSPPQPLTSLPIPIAIEVGVPLP